MIDSNNFDALCMALRDHPNFRGAVIWQRSDIEDAATRYGVDPDELDQIVDLGGWEDVACGEGWDYTIDEAAGTLQQEKED